MSVHCVASVLVGLANRGLSSEAANVQSDKELWAITSDNKLVHKHVNQPRSYQFFYVHCALYALVLGGLANSLSGL